MTPSPPELAGQAGTSGKDVQVYDFPADSVKKDRWAVGLLLFGLLLGCGWAIAFIVAIVVNGASVARYIALSAATGIAVLVAVLLVIVRRAPVRQIRITARGLEFVRTTGRRRSLSWSDPLLQILVWNRTGVAGTKMAPYSISMPRLWIANDLPRAAFDGVLEAAKSAALPVQTYLYDQGPDRGAILHVFGQGVRPPPPGLAHLVAN